MSDKFKTQNARQHFIANCQRTRDQYNQNPRRCPVCDQPISFEGRKRAKFCSRSCAATFNNQRYPKRLAQMRCQSCNKSLPPRNRSGLCCTCQNKARWQDWLINGLTTQGEMPNWLRNQIFTTRGRACEQCGWAAINPTTQRIPVTFHHINGNPHDHSPWNIIILCPNCHALTESYGSLNKGNGRQHRRLHRQAAVTS